MKYDIIKKLELMTVRSLQGKQKRKKSAKTAAATEEKSAIIFCSSCFKKQ